MTGNVRKAVRERYGEIARDEQRGCGCGCSSEPELPSGYTEEQRTAIPAGADLGLGCGTPLEFARLQPGETVLDLGSGGGVDCFLAARDVGAEGRVLGVDMTPDMVERARRNAEANAVPNVEFRLGEIEHLPVENESVDVVISNCVVNLSPDKPQVYRDLFRVLKPGGRVAISDIIALKELPESVRRDLDLVGACIGGASQAEEITGWLQSAGFADVHVTPRKVEAPAGSEFREMADAVAPARVEARKPA